MSKDILEQVKSVAADVFGVPAESLSGASSPESVEAWDSVQHLSLAMAVEAHFGITLEPEDIEKMQTLDGVAARVQRHTRA
ncbi:MAG: acyl carrier protein [Acidobacteria bacterium]|nr:MAG: acyl carrier protein [Acidobacteriota bacterium]